MDREPIVFHKAVVSFENIQYEAMSQHRFSALMTAVGMAFSAFTIREYNRGSDSNMPAIALFSREEDFDLFLSQMNEGHDPDDKWMSYNIERIVMK